MHFTEPGFLSTTAFACIVMFIIMFFAQAVQSTRIFAGMLAWLALLCCIVATGVLEANPMPGLMIFVAGINLVSIIFALSGVGKKLSQSLSIVGLVGFQAFRLPLELILHSWVEQKSIPQTMTWTGQNFDIISGILALVFIPLVKTNRKLAWIPNIVGFGLLLNVMRVAVMSSPLPFAWSTDQIGGQPLQLAFHFPYLLILPVCIGGALIGHILLTRALLARK